MNTIEEEDDLTAALTIENGKLRAYLKVIAEHESEGCPAQATAKNALMRPDAECIKCGCELIDGHIQHTHCSKVLESAQTGQR